MADKVSDDSSQEEMDCEKSSDSDSSSSEGQQQPLNILSKKSIKINQKFVVTFNKEYQKTVDREAKRNCKIAKFSSEWDFNELLSTLKNLKPEKYQNLFVFIINTKSVGFYKSNQIQPSPKIKKNRFIKIVEKLKKSLNKFSETRPLVLQLTSEEENVTKFYYKDSNSTKFNYIDQQQINFNKTLNFPTFLCSFFCKNDENFVDLIAENLSQIQNSSMILKFLRIFELPEKVFDKLVLVCAAFGSKSNLLAAIDAPFEGDGRMLSSDAQNYLKSMIYQSQDSVEADFELNQDQPEENLAEDDKSSTSSSNSNQESSDESDASSVISNSHMNPSVLHTAIQNSNKEVIDYLIANCTHLIQQLPFKHQVWVSTTAFDTNQFYVLCDLLEISDFPFPGNFKIDLIQHERLLGVVGERMKFQLAIETESNVEISKFIDNNLSLRIVYSPTNKSASKIAIDSKKYKVYFHLKSLGYQASEFYDIEEVLSAEELKAATKCKLQQRRKNVNKALTDQLKSVNLLCTRSFIHNRKVKKEQETEYRKKIRKWYEDINKIEFGSDLLDVVASCEDLKIIFDFESDSVENVSLESPNVQGSMYPSSKWIFVGAKLSDKKREQQIKGVLAHELCHYVMKLVFENAENPYYKHTTEIAKMFEAISKSIDKWSAEDSENPDDECNGIISSVFRFYKSEDFHPELIVRVVQILSEFDEDEQETMYLQDKYKELFEFFRFHVLPEMRIFNLKCRANVRKLNQIIELLPNISSQEIEFSASKDIKSFFENKFVIVTTNVPKLLLINIFNHLKEEQGNLVDAQNIFIDPEKLNNQEILKEYQNLMEIYPKINSFINCSMNIADNLNEIVANEASNLVFVASTEQQCKDLEESAKNLKINPVKIEIIYKWDDLNIESQKVLLETEVNFQNNSQFSFFDLLNKDGKLEYPTTTTNEPAHPDQEILKDFSEIIDDNLLNQIVENHQICINTNHPNEKYFQFLFQPREFMRHEKNVESEPLKMPELMSQNELLVDVDEKQYVLISDIAGNGKSWVMKNFTNELRKLNPMKWVTYVDLKQFVKEFKAQKSEEEFSIFIAEKILKPKQKFEEKIFTKLYENGKVIVLFDGFDEIAPDCAEFVSNLAASFESNEGNQLWIATRDYFELDLQEKLQTKFIYKLCDFKKEDSIDQIVNLWLVNDFEKQNLMSDFSEFAQKSKNTAYYQNIATKIHEKMVMQEHDWLMTVGHPQLTTMIADISKDDKNATLDLRQFQVFEKFIQKIYERWSYEKGQLRKMANIESQSFEANFWKFHQFAAVRHHFPKHLKAFYPDYDGSEWSEEEIIACGLMSKFFGLLLFTHQTFGEFFIANHILKYLRTSKTVDESALVYIIKRVFLKKEADDSMIEILASVLTDNPNLRFGVVRMLLNEAIEDISILDKIQGKMRFFVGRFYKMDNFSDYFTKNLETLADFVIRVLKNGNYEKIKEILYKSAKKVASDTKNPKMFSKFQDFLFEFLKIEDLKDLITKEELFKSIIKSSLSEEIFEEFVLKVETKIGSDFIKERLKSVNSDGSIFHLLCKSSNFDRTKKFIEILQKTLKSSEIIELMQVCDKEEKNVLHLCAKTGNNLFWEEIEALFASQNLSEVFKELVTQKGQYGATVLFFVATCCEIEFHKTFWEFLLRNFENREDLKNFLLENVKDAENFIHILVTFQLTDIIELTFKILKENLNDTQYKEVLATKNKEKRNLLQIAAYGRGFDLEKFYIAVTNQSHSAYLCHQHVETHKILWKIYRDSCKTNEEFLEILSEGDCYGTNILHNAAFNSPGKVFEFIIEEIDKFQSREEKRKFFSGQDALHRNLLLSAAIALKSLKTHQLLWEVFEKYFEPPEILSNLLPCKGAYGNNILLCAANNNTKEVVEFIWSKIKTFLNHDKQVEYLKTKNFYGEDIQKWSVRNRSYPGVHQWAKKLICQYGIDVTYKLSIK